MWRSDSDWDHSNIQTTIECSDQIHARRINQRHVITSVESPLLQEQTRDLLSFLVELRAGESLLRCSSVVEESEESVVSGGTRSPAQDLCYELILLASSISSVILQSSDIST